MIMQEHEAWLSGRAMLMEEIEARVLALRAVTDRRGVSQGFRGGLVLFLERRLEHLRDVLVAVQESPHVDPPRQQSLDRMLAAIVGTLRHVELEMNVDASRDSEWTPIPAPDRRMVSTRRTDSTSLTHRAVAHHEGR